MTFGQSSPHDNYFFHYPQEIVAGAPRQPMIKIDNAKIATRHVNSFLFQTFFHSVLDKKPPSSREVTASLQKSLGLTLSFFKDEEENPFTWSKFKTWLEENMADASSSMLTLAASWIPDEISKSSKAWIKEQGKSLIAEIEIYALDIKEKEEKSEHLAVGGNDNLLGFLFNKGILPSYAFPTDLCS